MVIFKMGLLKVLLLAGSASAQIAIWEQRAFDSRHTGRSPYQGVSNAVLKWNYTYDSGSSTPAVASDGKVVVLTGAGVYCFDGLNGQLVWTRTGAEYIGYADSSPAIYGQQVFVNGNSRLQALSLSTGALQWTSVAGGYGESSPVLGPSGQWLVVGGYGGLYKVNTANGAVAWTFVPSFTPPAYSSPSIHTSPALSADFSTAYLTVTPNVTWSGGGGGSGIALYAIDTSTGAQRWAYRTSNPGDGETYSSPTVLDNGDIVFSTTSTVYCVTASGVQRWAFTYYDWAYGGMVAGNTIQSPAVGHPGDNKLYFGVGSAIVFALDQSTGALVWNTPIPCSCGAWLMTDPGVTVAPDGTVYLSSWGMYALNGSTGEILWSEFHDQWYLSGVVVTSDGSYFTSGFYGLHALGPAGSPSPTRSPSSISATPSASGSAAATVSPVSLTATATMTKSLTASATRVSGTPTLISTRTPTGSKQSLTSSPTITATMTATRSKQSISSTPTLTRSGTATPPGTPSGSGTRSRTPPASVSPSGTPPASITPSGTPPPSSSGIPASASATRSVLPTLTPTRTPNFTPAAAVDPWDGFGCDGQSSGLARFAGTTRSSFGVRWNLTLPNGGTYSTPALRSNKEMVIGGSDGAYAFDWEVGNALWTYSEPGAYYDSSPVFSADGSVVMLNSGSQGGLIGLDKDYGGLLWTSYGCGAGSSSPKLSQATGLVYCGGWDHMAAIDPTAAGSVVWTASLPLTGLTTTPALSVDEAAVYITVPQLTSEDSSLIAYDAAGGAKLWEWGSGNASDVTGSAGSGPSVGSNDVIYHCTAVNCYAVSRSGFLLWSFPSASLDPLAAGPPSMLSLSPDGQRVYGSVGGYVAYALSAANGALLWRTELPCGTSGGVNACSGAYSLAGVTVGPDDVVYVGSVGLWALVGASGSVLFNYDLPGGGDWVTSGVAIASDGSYVIGGYAGFYALGSGGRAPTSSRTKSGTATRSASRTPTPSRPAAVSVSSSGTPAAAASSSSSRSASSTGSLSRTPSASAAVTSSPTPTGSDSPASTSTGTSSNSQAPSATSSGTAVASGTGLPSISAPVTSSPTASISGAATGTPSVSGAATGTPSVSGASTGTPSSTKAAAATTPAGTATPSRSATPSLSRSRSASRSLSPSRSPSPTGSKSKGASPSISATPSKSTGAARRQLLRSAHAVDGRKNTATVWVNNDNSNEE